MWDQLGHPGNPPTGLPFNPHTGAKYPPINPGIQFTRKKGELQTLCAKTTPGISFPPKCGTLGPPETFKIRSPGPKFL